MVVCLRFEDNAFAAVNIHRVTNGFARHFGCVVLGDCRRHGRFVAEVDRRGGSLRCAAGARLHAASELAAGATHDLFDDLLFDLRERRSLSLVVVTHNTDLAARADRQLVMAGGRLQPPGAG